MAAIARECLINGDYKSAEDWYIKAAEASGTPAAQLEVAHFYHRIAISPPMNETSVKADKWFEKAVAQVCIQNVSTI